MQARLLAKIDKRGPDECWPWKGGLHPDGHAQFRVGDRKFYAHRLVYELFVGPIPEGFVVHHTCEQPDCMNPDHLLAVTRREHADLHRPEFCIHGHNEWTWHSNGRRICRACDRDRHRRRPA